MQAEFIFRIILFIFIFLFAEITSYFALYSLYYKKPKSKRQLVSRRYWIFSIIFIIIIFPLFLYTGFAKSSSGLLRHNFFIAAVIMLVYLPKIIFGLIWVTGVLISFFIRFFNKLFFKRNKIIYLVAIKFYKSITRAGLLLALLFAVAIIYGMSFGKTNFKVKNVIIKSDMVPLAFDEFKIVQFSDTHLGSFNNKSLVKKGIDKIVDIKPDIIFFTGDLVNTDPYEAADYIEMFRNINAPYGKFAVLGNHDMDDFLKWRNSEPDTNMSNEVARILNDMGFTVLRNSNIIIYKDSDTIAIVGVDNWGKPPFSNNADIDKAVEGINKINFRILLLHDPNPLEENILPHHKFDLVLSGHTHGMQLGFNFQNFRWTPVQFRYKYTMGLYEIDDCTLYVNAGFGFIGFAARIGVSPEISLITLKTIQN